MIDWEGEDLSPNKDQGITKDLISDGEGHLTPSDGSLLEG